MRSLRLKRLLSKSQIKNKEMGAKLPRASTCTVLEVCLNIELMSKLTKTLFASFALVSIVFLTGCNTFRGVGEDIESMGESMQKAGN